MDFAFGRDLALIWLSILCFVALLVPLVAFYFAVRLMNVAQRKTEEILQQGQMHIKTVHLKTDQASESVAKPVIRARAYLASLQGVTQKIAGQKK